MSAEERRHETYKRLLQKAGLRYEEPLAVERSGGGLLSNVEIISGSNGSDIVAKSLPDAVGSAVGGLPIEALFRNEVKFYEWVDRERLLIPTTYLVDDEMILMTRYSEAPQLNQVNGIRPEDARRLVRALGQLHTGLALTNEARRFKPEVRAWWNTLELVKETLPAFRGLILDADTDHWAWLDNTNVRGLTAKLQDWASVREWTVCSMDMRTGNILGTPEAPIFIDWQFADHGPGGFDLASLLGTSGPDSPSLALLQELVGEYHHATTLSFRDAWSEFIVGVLARALFTTVVTVLLPHPTAEDQAARRIAVRRLSGLLAHVGEEALDELSSRGSPGSA